MFMELVAANLIFEQIVSAFIFILPSYFANSSPVVFGGGTPIDFNKKLFGKKIFGEHKTWRGFFGGLAAGTLIAYIESLFIGEKFLYIGFALAAGALLGDLFGSFVKRRLGIKEGKEVFLIDEAPFIIFSLLFGYGACKVFSYPFLNMFQVAFIIAASIFIHQFVNFIYKRYFPWIRGKLRL